jgi:hypothetical protein
MKHILNDMSEQEKNSIREQHTGGMKVMTENFNKLINSKLGDSKPLVNEQVKDAGQMGLGTIYNELKKYGFKMDSETFYTWSVYKGGDSNGYIIQFQQDPPRYSLFVSKNNKAIVDKEYPLKNPNQTTPEVNQILNDLKKFEPYPLGSKLGDLKPLVREEEDMEMSDEKEFFKFEGKSMETIQKLISQLPRTTKFLAITNSEGVDFSEMDLCNDFPRLVVVSLKNTPNNIKETNGDCVELLVKEENLYVVNKNL